MWIDSSGSEAPRTLPLTCGGSESQDLRQIVNLQTKCDDDENRKQFKVLKPCEAFWLDCPVINNEAQHCKFETSQPNLMTPPVTPPPVLQAAADRCYCNIAFIHSSVFILVSQQAKTV